MRTMPFTGCALLVLLIGCSTRIIPPTQRQSDFPIESYLITVQHGEFFVEPRLARSVTVGDAAATLESALQRGASILPKEFLGAWSKDLRDRDFLALALGRLTGERISIRQYDGDAVRDEQIQKLLQKLRSSN